MKQLVHELRTSLRAYRESGPEGRDLLLKTGVAVIPTSSAPDLDRLSAKDLEALAIKYQSQINFMQEFKHIILRYEGILHEHQKPDF